MPTPRRSRAENRAHMEFEILRLGRAQLLTRGPGDLSLRQIARDLGVASSAVYRYVADRDALITLLVVDGYTDLAEAVMERVEGVPDPRGQLAAFGHGMRDWARRHPARWALIYGTPVPGYQAPQEATTMPGTRLMALLTTLVHRLPVSVPEPQGRYRDYLEAGIAELDVQTDPAIAAMAVQAWCAIVGTVSMEVFGQLGQDVSDVGEQIMDATIERLLQNLV